MAKDPSSLRNNIRKTTNEQRNASKSIATPAMHTVSKMVELLKPYELSLTQRGQTFQEMLSSSCIWSSLSSRMTSIEVSQTHPKIKYDLSSERSLWLRDFIEYNLKGMKKTTRQVGRDFSEMTINGFAPSEITAKIDSSGGDYDGMFVLDDIVYIDPLTLDKVKPFVTKNGGREITHWRQLTSAFIDTDGKQQTQPNAVTGAVEIDARKVALASYGASSGKIFSSSPLLAVYSDWREMTFIQDLLLSALNKDLSGMPVLKLPTALMVKAKDPNSEEYKTVQQLTEQMTNLHQGSDSFCIIPSDLAEGSSTVPEFDISFKGIEGAGSKQFDMVEIINDKRRAIYTVLGAAHLIAGEDGGGSYNVLEGKANISAFMSLRDNEIIDELYNTKIIPMILRLNGLTDEKLSDIPVYSTPPPQPVSLDEWGKAVNRTARLLPAHPDVGNAILEKLGIDYRIPADTTPEEYREILFDFIEPSKVGSGEGSSGSGSTQEGGSQSDNNSENAS